MSDIAVFEINDLEVRLPTEWARRSQTATVAFRWCEAFGWGAHVHGDDDRHALSFPWTDHVDAILRGEGGDALPVAADSWWDLEQGWWGVVECRAGEVFVAETDLDALLDTPDTTLSLHSPGVVLAGEVLVTWSAFSVAAWERAWAAARVACARGEPTPSVTSWSCL